MDQKSMTAELRCNVCQATFETKINPLSDPIDVFTEWLDETVDMQTSEVRNIQQRQQQQHRGIVANEDEEEDNDE